MAGGVLEGECVGYLSRQWRSLQVPLSVLTCERVSAVTVAGDLSILLESAYITRRGNRYRLPRLLLPLAIQGKHCVDSVKDLICQPL